MRADLLLLRVLVVSASGDDRDLFRQAAAAAAVPVEIFEAEAAAMACRCIADGVDLVFLDVGFADVETATIVAAARAAKKPPFTVQLAMPSSAVGRFETDGLAMKPSQRDEARRLIRRAMRVRMPNRVLVVDDSGTMRSIVKKILGATRFPLDISEANEGFVALKLASESAFDIVFLDYNMPGFSGLETLSEFKREKRRADVVIMTSTQDATLAERVRKAGAVYLKKPFFPADIDAVLCRFYGLTALNPRRA